MSANNRTILLNRIADVLDAVDDDTALAVLSSYQTLRGLGRRSVHEGGPLSCSEGPGRSGTRPSKGKAARSVAAQPSGVTSTRAQRAHARELASGITLGQAQVWSTRLLQIKGEIKDTDEGLKARWAQNHGIAVEALDQVGRCNQYCQDLQSWLKGDSWRNRAEPGAPASDSQPTPPRGFRELIALELSGGCGDSQGEVSGEGAQATSSGS